MPRNTPYNGRKQGGTKAATNGFAGTGSQGPEIAAASAIRSFSTSTDVKAKQAAASAAVSAAKDLSSETTSTRRFQDLQNILHPTLLNTITQNLQFDEMMPVQAASLDDLLTHRIDCLVQAKTGTGKTLAFLIPAIQTMISKRTRSGISLLVITPTRELAQQIAKEAEALLQNLPQYKICVAIGGTNKDSEQRRLLSGCDILIATPGRLIDHLSEEEIVRQFSTLNTLVLDEADRLLDMGFMPSLQQIVRALPDKSKTSRQGMLFSATIADHVQKVAHLVLSKDYKFISTIPEGEVNTHERVPQILIEVPQFTDVAPALVQALQQECQANGQSSFKAIVFAPTAAMADWYADVLTGLNASNTVSLPPVSVIHSRASQSKRTKLTADFKNASAAIMVATDVIARGMDFPSVSHVFQVGIPSDRESYIHRLGRTARAGKEGRGILIIASPEKFFPQWTLKDITLQPVSVDYTSLRPMVDQVAVSIEDFEKPYQAWLGYYKNYLKPLKWDNKQLVQEANHFAIEALGSPGVPGLQRKTIGKMGLKGVPGLVVRANDPEPAGGRGGGSGRGPGAGGMGNGQNSNGAPDGFGAGRGRGRGGRGSSGSRGKGSGRGGRR